MITVISCREFYMNRVRKQIGLYGDSTITGKGLTVAVLDTGMAEHPDLSGKILAFYDFVNKRIKSYDDNGHGTHVCGIIGGTGELSKGLYRGIAPDVKFVIGKILDKNGEGEADALLLALEWIEKLYMIYHIRVLNISISMKEIKDKKKKELIRKKIENLWDYGIIVVCAAGNHGPGEETISEIGESEKVIAVGCHDENYFATDRNRCSNYSARGRKGTLPRKPDLVAPGTHIISCNAFWVKRRNNYMNGYVEKSGTSMATAIVTGVISLILQANTNMTNDECRLVLIQNLKELNLPWNQQGWGLVQAKNLRFYRVN